MRPRRTKHESYVNTTSSNLFLRVDLNVWTQQCLKPTIRCGNYSRASCSSWEKIHCPDMRPLPSSASSRKFVVRVWLCLTLGLKHYKYLWQVSSGTLRWANGFKFRNMVSLARRPIKVLFLVTRCARISHCHYSPFFWNNLATKPRSSWALRLWLFGTWASGFQSDLRIKTV